MPLFTKIPTSDATSETVDTFGGYNHGMKIGEGEFFDMKNLCSDNYPLLSTRNRRGIPALKLKQSGGTLVDLSFKDVRGTVTDPEGNLWVVGKGVYAGAQTLTRPHLYKIHKLLTIGTVTHRYSVTEDFSTYAHRGSDDWESRLGLTDTAKQIFCAGNRLYIFPDCVWVSMRSYEAITQYGTETVADYGSMSQDWSNLASNYEVKYSPCNAKGEVYTGQTVSETAPASPSEGAIWVDTSNDSITWKKYSSSQWIALSDVYVKINIANEPYGFMGSFDDGDGIEIASVIPAAAPQEIKDLNGSHILIKRFADLKSIVITGLIKEEYTQASGLFRLKRVIPDMDYIVQCNNRLWGCKFLYSADTSETVNEIYASKLGDFNNWNVFQGISTDSYVASVGSAGEWTGAANVGGYPTFFKSDHFHKVYVSSSGAHQIVDKSCHGVQKDCSGSVQIVGGVCFFKSGNGVMYFDGSTFSNVGDALGGVRYVAADGGTVGDKYYLSLQDETGVWSLFVYDTRKGLWHKEDNTHALYFSSANDDAFFITEDAHGNAALNIISNYNVIDTYENALPWEAVTGLQGYGYVGQKYISRFNLRMQLPVGSSMDVFIEYNSDGVWHHQGHIRGTGTRTFMLPVRPRRCDHFRVKLSGTGDVRIYSFSKYFAGGSDVS